jgi:hypothetical protein
MNLYDTDTDCQSVNSTDNYHIHQGEMYTIPFYTASVAAAGAESISFTTPTKGKFYLKPIKFSAVTNIVQVAVTEGAVMASGNSATPQNQNRLKGNDSGVVVATAATLTTAGTLIYNDGVGAGTGATQNEETGASQEIVLKPNTTYSITFSNVGASTATVIYYTIRWIER